jgi:hypothetical protein
MYPDRGFQPLNRLAANKVGNTFLSRVLSRKFLFSSQTVRLFFLANFGWALDFRSEEAGAAALIQGSLLFSYCFFGVLCISTLRKRIRRVSLAPTLISLWFLGEALMVDIFYQHAVYPVFTSIIPVLLYVVSTYLTLHVVMSEKDLRALEISIKVFCLLCVISRVVRIAATVGLDPNIVRYSILSSAVTPALGLVVTGSIFKVSKLDITIVLANVGALILSLTRTLFLVLASQFTIYLSAISFGFVPLRRAYRVIAVGLLFVLFLGGDWMLGTGLTDLWTSRLFSSDTGIDPTLLTRQSEVEFMSNAFTESVGSALFGHGVAAETSLVGEKAAIVAEVVGEESILFHSTGFGHHNHWSLLFVGGLVAGLPLLGLQFLQGFWALTFFALLRRRSDYDPVIARLGVWGGTIVVGMLVAGFLSGTFGDRGFCIWYGIGTGLLLGTRKLVQVGRR